MSRVDLNGVSRTYGAMIALHRTDLAVAEGEFLTLLGPSGCGKTTTLRMVAGFVAPSTGRIRIDDEDVTRLPPNRRRIGMVFQDYALFPHMTVAENIAFALRERRVQRQAIGARVAELLELIHLPETAARYPAQLSGGQQQRVALARAIAHPPRVLLMDEPLSALDLKLREAMQTELRRIQRTLGITTIFVTHDQAEAMSLSDTIAVMSQGRIVQRGTAQDIYDHPANRFVASFVGQINVLPATVLGPDGVAAQVAGQVLAIPRSTPGPATIGVRPHDIGFAAAGLPGTVLSRRFGGNLWQVRVQVAGADWLVETRPGDGVPAEGSAVQLAWPADRTLVLRD
jgi:putative spermidine/putrescine transport system ATP-binding protein